MEDDLWSAEKIGEKNLYSPTRNLNYRIALLIPEYRLFLGTNRLTFNSILPQRGKISIEIIQMVISSGGAISFIFQL